MIVMQDNRNRRGFSLIELLIVVAIILIIAGIAVPKMQNQLMAARETAVIEEIRTIHKAQIQYYSQFGTYATALAQLGPPTSGNIGPEGSDLIPSTLSSGEKDGHVFTLTGSPGGYVIQVQPRNFGSDGRRTFYSDQTLEIHQNYSEEPATAESPVLQ